MKLILAILALTTCSMAALAQQPTSTDDAAWKAQVDAQYSRMQYIDDMQYKHAQQQIRDAVHDNECNSPYPSAYGLSKQDCQ